MENNSQAIELKGIVRNQTKIGVQDGQCDDIVNLRFKDGSWRVSADGKQVYKMENEKYSNLYVHTNSGYHHLLGVSNDKLYWFANIENDGETFVNIERKLIAEDVGGGCSITQVGHIINIITSAGKLLYFIYVTTLGSYRTINYSDNSDPDSRELFPFGGIPRLNLDCDNPNNIIIHEDQSAGHIVMDSNPQDINYEESGALVPKSDESETHRAKQIWHSSMLNAFAQAEKKNLFTRPFLAVVAVKLYDGTHVYATSPIYLAPREAIDSLKMYSNGLNPTVEEEMGLNFETNSSTNIHYQIQAAWINRNNAYETLIPQLGVIKSYGISEGSAKYFTHLDGKRYRTSNLYFVPTYISGAFCAATYTSGLGTNLEQRDWTYLRSQVKGCDLIITLGDLSVLFENEDIFKGISIFITPEVNVYKMASEDYKSGILHEEYGHDSLSNGLIDGTYVGYTTIGNLMYRPAKRKDEDIIYDLVNSPFYLLRDFTIKELKEMNNKSTKVDLSKTIYKNTLKDIANQPTLDNEAFERKNYNASTMYVYNNKLHIANYISKFYAGYPIDMFNLSNKNLQIDAEGDYDAIIGVIEGKKIQYERGRHYFVPTSMNDYANSRNYIKKAKEKGTCFAYIEVHLKTENDNIVVSHIEPYYNPNLPSTPTGFVEYLSAFFCYPDNRAEKAKICVIQFVEHGVDTGEYLISKIEKELELVPHPYYNLSYYIDPKLKPIEFNATERMTYEDFISDDVDASGLKKPTNNDIEGDNSNCIKVSKANNPFVFPYEMTYSIGSSEIVALMSNSVAVGTGQTGDAPLYVFCKDGIYALLVDSTGEITYTNARIIARDVCNNAKSITPIDSGVVFTTDRGIMSIAGSEVVEIGSAAEGDVFDIADTGDKAKKIMFNAFTMQQLAEFPQTLVENTDFLTYLKGAIVNYNHNERELMVSNPDKDYTYVMDRNGNWSRRAFTAQEYVNNYPTSYRIDKAGNFYKVDEDDNDTNKVYLLSNVIKLGTIAFKQAYRLIVRGYFETNSAAYGKINGVPVKVVGSFIDRMKDGEGLQMTYITQYGQQMWVDVDNNNYVLNEQIQILDPATGEDITSSVVSANSGQYYRVVKSYEKVGCYVFGSYDGRQWSLLGGNEKGGKFTDIGCKIAHTDIRFLRVCLAGKLSKDTRIDYIEVSADGSALNGKLR